MNNFISIFSLSVEDFDCLIGSCPVIGSSDHCVVPYECYLEIEESIRLEWETRLIPNK